jgi:hypothetical protein
MDREKCKKIMADEDEAIKGVAEKWWMTCGKTNGTFSEGSVVIKSELAEKTASGDAMTRDAERLIREFGKEAFGREISFGLAKYRVVGITTRGKVIGKEVVTGKLYGLPSVVLTK